MARNIDTDRIQGSQGDVWLKTPYVGLVTIKSISYSEDVKNKKGEPYTGTPFFKYLVETDEGEKRKTEIVFWRPKQADDAKKADGKLYKIKKFYDNCEVPSELKGEVWLEAIIGKQCNMVLQIQEKVLELAKPPKIIANPNYWFSSNKEQPIDGMTMDKLTKRISEEEMKAFHKLCDDYNNSEVTEEKTKSIVANKDFDEQVPTEHDDLPDSTEIF